MSTKPQKVSVIPRSFPVKPQMVLYTQAEINYFRTSLADAGILKKVSSQHLKKADKS